MDATAGERPAFTRFEHAAWGDPAVAETYATWWGGLTRQAAGPLLAAAGARAGAMVLDIACGPGFLGEAALARGARVVGVDFSRAMLRLAQGRAPALRLVEGDAEALPLRAAVFDAAVMAFGLLHLARPEAALAEAHRVLRPGGRLALSVWAAPPATRGFAIVQAAVQAHGDPDVPLPPGPPFFRFADAGECRRALQAAGFTGVGVQTVPMVWRSASADLLCTAFEQGTARTRGLLRAQAPAALARIRQAVRQQLETLRVGSGYEVPMPCLVVSARKP